MIAVIATATFAGLALYGDDRYRGVYGVLALFSAYLLLGRVW